MIYFDNAATTARKPFSVVMALLTETIRSANPGRGGHRASVRAALKVEETRELIRSYFFDGEVVFTKNCTEALNLAVCGLTAKGRNSKKVITTYAEHNSVLRPLKRLERQGKVKLVVIEPTTEAFEKAVDRETEIVVLSAVSNVTGKSADVEKLLKIVREKSNAVTVVDGAQSAGKVRFNMENVDLFATSGHKSLYGTQGTGFLLVRRGVMLEPLLVGGTGTSSVEIDIPSDMPEAFESGTLNTPGIVALGAAMKFISAHGERIAKREIRYAEYLCKRIKECEKIHIYSCQNGIVLLNIEGVSCTEVADILSSRYHICVRAGLHCAPLMHKKLGTSPDGAVRIGFGRNNDFLQTLYLAFALRKIAETSPNDVLAHTV